MSQGPSLTPSLSASPALAFPASLVDYNSIWSLIYLHNRYRVPVMCQALARSWGATNPAVGLSVSLDGREKWKGSLPTHMYVHTYTYIHIHADTHIPTHTPAYPHTHLHACIYTPYLHTHNIHTHTHSHIYTQTQSKGKKLT